MIEDVLIPAFWYTATQLIKLIVPIVAIKLVFWMFTSTVFGRR